MQWTLPIKMLSKQQNSTSEDLVKFQRQERSVIQTTVNRPIRITGMHRRSCKYANSACEAIQQKKQTSEPISLGNCPLLAVPMLLKSRNIYNSSMTRRIQDVIILRAPQKSHEFEKGFEIHTLRTPLGALSKTFICCSGVWAAKMETTCSG